MPSLALLARTAAAHHAAAPRAVAAPHRHRPRRARRYAIACAEAPFRHCWHCGGDGRNGPGARSRCKHCDGTGLQLRYGRRVFNHLSRSQHAARRADEQRAREHARRLREQTNPWKDPR